MDNYKFLIKYLNPFRFKLFLIIIGVGIVSLLAMPIPWINGLVIDALVEKSNKLYFIQLIAIMLGIQIVKYVISIQTKISLSSLNVNLVNNIKLAMLKRTVDLPMDFYIKKDIGYIVTRINECNNLNGLFSSSVLTSIIGVLDFIFSIFIALWINSKITLIVLSILPLIVFLSFKSSKNLKKSSLKLMESSANSNNIIYETIDTIEELKLHNYHKQSIKEVETFLKSFTQALFNQNKSIVYFTENISLINSLGSVALLLISGIFIYNGDITIGTYTALSQYTIKIFGNVNLFSSVVVQIKPIEVSISRIREFFEHTTESEEGGIELTEDIKQIQLEDINYSYNKEKSIIKNLSLDLESGKCYRISGSNGSGKSTLLKIISGLLKIDSGKIYYNGIDAMNISKESLRNKIGFVTHRCYLFNGTILQNIFLNNEPNREKLLEIIAKYELDTYFNEFENGIDTTIAHNGKNISAGQRQFIAFLRAILSEKDILFFDEPISNIDIEKQKKIVQLIYNITDKVVVVISHSTHFDGFKQIQI